MTPALLLALVAGQPAPRPAGLAPDLAAPIRLTAGGKPIDVERSGHAAPCVADLDGDGRPDLLVGDMGGWFEGKPQMTAAEAAEEREALDRLPAARAEWAAAYRDLAAALDADPPAPRAAELRRAVGRLRGEIARLEAVRDRYRSQSMTHGHVWLFRRQPAEGGAR